MNNNTINIALIKNNICVNVVVFDTLTDAKKCLEPLHEYDDIVPCPDGYGIGHEYKDGVWNISTNNNGDISKIKESKGE